MLNKTSTILLSLIAGVFLVSASVARASGEFPKLPEPVTSFGAITYNDWLYVFGGHKGERHEYCIEMVSGSFQRLNLKNGVKWEPLPDSTAGQGLAIVACDGGIYRIGGMAARNHEKEKQDLYSVPLVQKYSVRRAKWSDLPPMPAPRSSHDAVVLGRKLYVAGGWNLEGKGIKPIWHTNAIVLDLDHPSAGWKSFSQPFSRRALALGASGKKICCIGGMTSDNETSLAVDLYDTATGRWSKGPELPSGQFKGFGCSAIAQDGRLYAAALQGDLLRLSKDGGKWEVVGRLQHPRMAYRLATSGDKNLVALGGEDGEENKTPDIELLKPATEPLPAKQNATAATSTPTPN